MTTHSTIKNYNTAARKTTLAVVVVLSLTLCHSCKAPQYIPVETIKTEYRDNYIRDSIFQLDSVFIRERGDTVTIERYRYIYKDKTTRDSIYINDTIRVPYPVEVEKKVKARLNGWQNFQIWCGRFALLLVWLFLMRGLHRR
jgi:hypothetical protein